MMRAIFELILTVLVITLLRSVIGILAKAMFHPSAPPAASPGRRPSVPAGGELKKDPVCGTFISTGTAIHKSIGGEMYYFCSTECRDKFKG
jgi:YHS domain-containing protein